MFRELVELGNALEARGELPPPCFYQYGEPIRWVVHLWPCRVYLEKTELNYPRPACGRTSSIEAHLLADEAAYALGVGDSGEKHSAFRALTQKFLEWPSLQDRDLRDAIGWLEHAFDGGLISADPRFVEVESKDWVSFVPESGPLSGKHLFQHPEACAFWVVEMKERSASRSRAVQIGECAVCGEQRPLIGKIPLKVKLASSVSSLHSLNAGAFVSYCADGKPEIFKRAHLGLCFQCGDTAVRAFNYLSNDERHHRSLLQDPERRNRDKLTNQTALFWLKIPASIQVDKTVVDTSEEPKAADQPLTPASVQVDETVVDSDVLLDRLGEFLGTDEDEVKAPPTLSQIKGLLDMPWWKPERSRFRLDEYGFYLAVLSPNIGRIAVREWMGVPLATLKDNLKRYLDAARIIWRGREFLPTITMLIQSVPGSDPNLSRGILRSAFLGYSPPHNLLRAAVCRLRNPDVIQEHKKDGWLPPLIAAIKLTLFYNTQEAETMTQLDSSRRTPAYLCGRLLAILEYAQQMAHSFSLKTTIVDRFYGAASTAPAYVFGNLIRLATTAHLPEAGGRINQLVEKVCEQLDDVGGFPSSLALREQAEFALGFYHQRADLRAASQDSKTTDQDSETTDQDSKTTEEGEMA